MNGRTDTTDRETLVERLRDALDALERGDETALRRKIDVLAAARTRPLVQGLGRLARELSQALGELPVTAAGDLNDACARLDHVVAMTEKASHRTLDLTESCRTLVEQLQATALAPEQQALLAQVRGQLSDMALAQSYQDLTGQIIRRVAGIVRRVHEGFGALGLPPKEEPGEAKLAGPAVAGLDRHAVSQNDADALLSDLGL
ncbi:chemotaxis protein [Pseudoxanthomonas broegbernensis]|uniref:Protein phosphatase CheZ n=1 Tax=Pseudoxanthomonas broegbernensis TaxID=83619 RepID=A0A7V8GLA4_9GAMM|nr:protein phosphatase CheZ [Pseudoxanthomonas broegbernensis]KAF1685623.1 chemotaxis protein [Pseudoxanthomonas broegbernensis]MBB6065999.1 chemotaxis protein CheZ [Pseudoxanthomonas broegbernensis]